MSDSGGGSTQVVNQAPPQSQDELDLIALNKQLAQKQLANIDQLAPFQAQLLQSAQSQLDQQGKYDAAYNSAISPEEQAAQARSQFDLSTKLGQQQSELADLQLAALKQGGRATPEQLKAIQDATDAGITAGTGDIDTQTQRGIGLISDELANSRGLRLSDSPIKQEAALLVRAAGDQKSSLINNLRANQANATLNYPLAVQGLQSGINLNQQTVAQSAQQFQAQLRQQAYQNRLSMTGQASQGGIGLASINPGNILGSLTQSRLANSSQNTQKGIGLADAGGIGTLLSGAAAAAPYVMMAMA